jgi:hypothetical protein
MMRSIIFFVAFTGFALSFSPAFSSETRAEKSEMIGEIRSGPEAVTGITYGSVTPININRDLIAKGDRLDLYKKVDDQLTEHLALKRVGSLIVLSGSGSPPIGKIIKLSEEIDGVTYVAFTLPKSHQLNRYLPFIKSMADSFALEPEVRPLKVALIDAINQYGDRTKLTDALFKKVIKSICERPQFLCADRSAVTEILRNYKIATSRNIDSDIERELLSKQGVEVIVTGHLLKRDNKIEFLLRARSTREDSEPRQVWRIFKFPDTGFVSKMTEQERAFIK